MPLHFTDYIPTLTPLSLTGKRRGLANRFSHSFKFTECFHHLLGLDSFNFIVPISRFFRLNVITGSNIVSFKQSFAEILAVRFTPVWLSRAKKYVVKNPYFDDIWTQHHLVAINVFLSKLTSTSSQSYVWQPCCRVSNDIPTVQLAVCLTHLM